MQAQSGHSTSAIQKLLEINGNYPLLLAFHSYVLQWAHLSVPFATALHKKAQAKDYVRQKATDASKDRSSASH